MHGCCSILPWSTACLRNRGAAIKEGTAQEEAVEDDGDFEWVSVQTEQKFMAHFSAALRESHCSLCVVSCMATCMARKCIEQTPCVGTLCWPHPKSKSKTMCRLQAIPGERTRLLLIFSGCVTSCADDTITGAGALR